MRMKKILILAATVAMCAACSHTYEINPVSKDGGKIGFGSYTETLTRAEARVQGTNTFLEGDTFAVYGSKKKAATVSEVFNNVVVTRGASAWDYENHRFWDTGVDSYTFYAVSPSKVGATPTETAALNTTTGLVAASTSITFAGNNSDILVADSLTIAKGDNNFNNYHTVDLSFNHIASLVDIKVRKSANVGAAKVTITDVKLINIDATGTFAVNNYSTSNHPAVVWTADGLAAKAEYSNASGVYGQPASLPDSIPATVAGASVIDSLIVMPQTFANGTDVQKLQISYTITPVGGDTMTFTDVECKLYDFDDDHTGDTPADVNVGTKIASWAPGKHYVFYVTIDVNAIMFTASINDWDPTTINGYYYLMN